jgi:hypothetical protein
LLTAAQLADDDNESAKTRDKDEYCEACRGHYIDEDKDGVAQRVFFFPHSASQ